MQRITYLFLVLVLPLGLMAQEHLSPLHGNKKVALAARQMQANNTLKRPSALAMDTVTLPFLDDFSKPGPYPDTTWWIDRNVFVNYGLPVCPHTLGVATFDGLDSVGKPYYPSNSPYTAVQCDRLTSKPISWKNGATQFNLGDSIYLSFYYQGGSLGGRDSKGHPQLSYYPSIADTLLLQFRAAGDTTWNTIWYHLGYAIADTDTNFHMVMIPFDTGKYIHSMATLNAYMKNGFQFRFLAYSCGAGDVDHWSIDEVYLKGVDRGYADTMQHDLAFAYQAPPLLANYSMEPWEQYQPGDLASTMHLFERNNAPSYTLNSRNIINAGYNYSINTIPATVAYPLPGAYDNIYPFVDSAYNKSSKQVDPQLINTNFPASLTGPTTFTITHYFIQSAPDFDEWNDTLRYNQAFGNSYAYDDGSAEVGYFINSNQNESGGGGAYVPVYLAYQFDLNKPDSIFGLNIYFDYVLVSNTSYTYKITLWNDNGGVPGTIIFQDSVQNPAYDFVGPDEFTTCYFKKKAPFLPAGKFYIGWEQTSGDSMNIGFDWNSDHSSKLFYSLNYYFVGSSANWQQSSFPGTLMIRPIMGDASQYVGIKNIAEPAADVTLYPNPAQNEVTLSGDVHGSDIRLMGADGRILFEQDNFSGTTINTSYLPNGFYIVQVTPKGKESTFKKLLISR